jgi:hypothetical protein
VPVFCAAVETAVVLSVSDTMFDTIFDTAVPRQVPIERTSEARASRASAVAEHILVKRAVVTQESSVGIGLDVKKLTAKNFFVYLITKLRGKTSEKDGLALATSPMST